MNKKTLIIIISIAVAVALAITGVVVWVTKSLIGSDGNKGTNSGNNGGSKGEMTISVDNVTASSGKTVKVPVRMSGNKGFMAVMLQCEYDKEVLEYVTYDKGDFLTDYEVNASNGVVKFLSLEDGDVDDDGVMVYLEFKVKGKSGASSDIKLVMDEGSICNYDEEILEVKTVNGKVTVK